MPKREYVTIPELAKVLGISRIAVYNRVKQGKIPAIRIGRSFGVPAAAVEGLTGRVLTGPDKAEVERAVRRTVKEYSEVLKLLGRA